MRDAWHLSAPYYRSEEKWSAWGLLAAIISLRLLLVGMTVVLSFWNREFFNSLQDKNYSAFWELLFVYRQTPSGFMPGFCEIAAVYIVVAVYFTYLQQWLLIRWRRWLTVRYLDECLASGVLAASGTAISFRHELARLAIEEAISPARRLELHRAALAALEDTADSDVARLAEHAEAASDAQAVLKYAPQAAARAASVGAHREAAALYGRAVRFVDEARLRGQDGNDQQLYRCVVYWILSFGNLRNVDRFR